MHNDLLKPPKLKLNYTHSTRQLLFIQLIANWPKILYVYYIFLIKYFFTFPKANKSKVDLKNNISNQYPFSIRIEYYTACWLWRWSIHLFWQYITNGHRDFPRWFYGRLVGWRVRIISYHVYMNISRVSWIMFP